MDKGYKQAFHRSTDTKELDHSDFKKPVLILCSCVSVGVHMP